MRADLLAAVDAFDRVLAAADGVVEAELLGSVASTVRATRRRAGYLGDTVVAALAGGTGSGKSSLVNALAGETVAEPGGMRPTTGVPMAWIPANPEPGLVRLLDDLGVDERVGQDRYDWLALIDLPDTDSVVVDHRHRVDALLPRVDLVVWVIDPEKYQDDVLHSRYLRPLADYHRQFLFVLNQVDRLDEETVGELVADLRTTLRDDGIPDPRIVPVAADPDVGPPVGLEGLVGELHAIVEAKSIVYDKLATDLVHAARRLSESPELGGSVGFDDRWSEVRRAAAERIAEGDRRGAGDELDGFVAALADQVGGGSAEELAEVVGPHEVRRAVDVAYESSGAFRRPEAAPAPGWSGPLRWVTAVAAVAAAGWAVAAAGTGGDWWWGVAVAMAAAGGWLWLGSWVSTYRGRATERANEEHRRSLVEPVAGQLDAQLGRKLRTVLRRRAVVTAAATELDLALAELERHLEE